MNKLPVLNLNQDILTSNRVGIRTCSDYSPFGVELDGRTVSVEWYRFGYQGSEKDNEFKGEGNSYTTEFRQLDPRLGRWLGVDPVIQPWQSSYCSMDNHSILMNDFKGNEGDIPFNNNDKEVNGIALNHEFWSIKNNSTSNIPNQINDHIILIKDSNSPDWASKNGGYVHQKANRISLENCNRYSNWENDDEVRSRMNYTLSILNEATEWADSDNFQTATFSYRHAMRNEKQTIIRAKKIADNFVRKQYEIALDYWENGETKLALFNLGVALHTLQDATSPAHAGFQIWTGKESLTEQISHVTQELMYPGKDSNLQKTTDWFINMFFLQQPLPNENLFNIIQHD